MKTPEYIIGIDTYDKNSNAYCVLKRHDDIIEVVSIKTVRDADSFKQEVEELVKHYNLEKFYDEETMKMWK